MTITEFIESKKNAGSHILLTPDSYAIFGKDKFDESLSQSMDRSHRIDDDY